MFQKRPLYLYGAAAFLVILFGSVAGYFGAKNLNIFGAGFSSPKITSASTASASFLPSSNNAFDLGAYGSAWRDAYVSGTAQFNNVTVTGTCTGCSGAATLSGGVQDSITIWNSSSVVGASSTFTYSSSTGLFSVLGTASSTAINTGNITAKNNNAFDVGSYGSAFKDVYSSGTILATAIQNAGTLTQVGASTFTGAVTINNLTTFNGNATPGTNNARDLGSVTTAWRDVYVSGSIRVSSGAASTTISSSGNITTSGLILPAVNNASDIGAPGLAMEHIYASGTANLGTLSTDGNTTLGDTSSDTVTLNARFASSLNSNANNTFDFGAYGTAWKDIYTSGTIRAGTGAASLTINGTTLSTTSGAANGAIVFDAGSGGTLRPPPARTNLQDVGTFGAALRNLYASTSLRVANGAASTTVATTGFFTNGGYFSGANNTSDIGSMGNAMKNFYASGSNIFATGLGATGAGDINVCWTTAGKLTQGATCGVSSLYYKEHVLPLKPEEMLKKVMQIQAVMFSYNENAGQSEKGKKDEGFIAEHIASIDPLLVDWREPTKEHLEWTEKNFPKLVRVNDEGKKEAPDNVRYDRISILTVAALQAQQAQIDQERTTRENQINAINARLDKQEGLITKLFKIIEKVIAKLRM